MDAIDAAASRIRLYRLDKVRFGARELAQIITASAEQVRAAMKTLEQKKGVVVDHAIEINRLENEADRMHQEAVMRLFDEERDPIVGDEVEGGARLPRGGHRPLRGRRQRARRRRRQVRVAALMFWVVVVIIAVALFFDYVNGFHDAANSIATVVSTRVLTPGKAVIWAAFFNFVAAFTFGTAVATTIGAA